MTQQEVVKTVMQSFNDTELSGRKALDEAIKVASDSRFKNFEELRTQFLTDQIDAKNWHTFLVEKCGIILDNADTGAISGSDAGGDKVKTATDIIPSKGKAKYPEDTSFTVDGLTIYGVPPKEELTADQQYVVRGLYSWWIRDSLALIKESYGFSFTDANTTNSRMKLKFVDELDIKLLAYVRPDSIDGKKYEARTLCVNMNYFKDMDPSDRHATTSSGQQHLDRTLVHELTHGIMASNVDYFMDMPRFLMEGGSAELIHGIDDERYNDIIKCAKDSTVFEKILTAIGEPPYAWNNRPNEVYAGGYIFMRYFAKQAGTDTTFDYDTYHETVSVDATNFATNYWDNVTIAGSSKADTITNSGENVSISAGKGDDVINNYSNKVTINAGSGADKVLNEGTRVSIYGGKSNDSISNSGTKVTISGGAGNDSIDNMGANVSIVGGSGSDTITNSGKNVTIDDGKGNDSITNHASKVLIYGDEDNDPINNYGSDTTIYGGAGDDYILNDSDIMSAGSKSTIYGGVGNDSIENKCDSVKIYGEDGLDYLSNKGKNVKVYGGADADYVKNEGDSAYISLGDGDDTINNASDSIKAYGGKGADYFTNYGDNNTLSGGFGNDTIYSGGTYVSINGGADDDLITNEGSIVTILGGKGNDVINNYADGEDS